MTALEYMEKQHSKHKENYNREFNRGAPEKTLNDIRSKIDCYGQAIKALKNVGENKPLKHYVVMCDTAAEIMGYDETHVTAVAHDRDEAKKILQEKSKDEKQYAHEHGWEIYTDSDDEFDAGEAGFYSWEHAHFYIEEIEG